MQSPSSQRRSGVQVEPSYRQLRRAKAAEDQRWQVESSRSGLLGAWLNLSAPPPASALASFAERERLRKAELSAYVAFGVFLIGTALIPNALQSRSNLYAIPAIIAAGIAAAVLNRSGFTRTAAVVLIAVFFVAIGGAMAGSPNLDLMWMPALDFFAVPVFLSGLLLSRRAPFGAAAVGAALVASLLVLKPRDPGLGHMVAQLGIYHFMIRPIGLMLIVAIASWLWGRSMEQAIRRADRAEEVAVMEHQLAEQKRQLDRGIQNLLETHVRVSNGDFSARAVTNQDNMLWQIAVSLNNLLSRLSKYGHVEHRLNRTESEIDHLAAAMESTREGRPANWPQPSGTRVDRLLGLVAGQPRQGHAPTYTSSTSSSSPFAYPQRPPQPARATHTPTAPDMMGGYTGPITGEWREVTGRHADNRPGHTSDHHAAASDRYTEQMRSVAWGQPQGGPPIVPARGIAPYSAPSEMWKEPAHQMWASDRADASAPSANWAMEPLPPLAPLHGAAHTELPTRERADDPNRTASPQHGVKFSESFPGQLREGASWEDLLGLRQTAPDAAQSPVRETPSAPTPRIDTNNWPDWPSFLRTLDAQNGD